MCATGPRIVVVWQKLVLTSLAKWQERAVSRNGSLAANVPRPHPRRTEKPLCCLHSVYIEISHSSCHLSRSVFPMADRYLSSLRLIDPLRSSHSDALARNGPAMSRVIIVTCLLLRVHRRGAVPELARNTLFSFCSVWGPKIACVLVPVADSSWLSVGAASYP